MPFFKRISNSFCLFSKKKKIIPKFIKTKYRTYSVTKNIKKLKKI